MKHYLAIAHLGYNEEGGVATTTIYFYEKTISEIIEFNFASFARAINKAGDAISTLYDTNEVIIDQDLSREDVIWLTDKMLEQVSRKVRNNPTFYLYYADDDIPLSDDARKLLNRIYPRKL